MQLTSNILMIRPAHFGYNKETAANNSFQTEEGSDDADGIQKRALREFDTFVEILRSNGVNVMVINDSDSPVKPDAVFPNNWITTHGDGTLITYPMYAPSRRAERNEQVIAKISDEFVISKRYTFDHYEKEQMFLEGTGSMILDRANKLVYACLSPRTNIKLLDKFCILREYRKVIFHAVDQQNEPIYHTNVMMSLGETFAVVCMDTIKEDEEKKLLMRHFLETNKAIIEITIDQMLAFAGNMLQVKNRNDKTFLVMSEQAFDALTREQITLIESHTNIIRSPISTFEKYGGGSARCMMAELFLSEK